MLRLMHIISFIIFCNYFCIEIKVVKVFIGRSHFFNIFLKVLKCILHMVNNQGELYKYFVILFEKAWNANLCKCVIQEQLWALFKLRYVFFFLSKVQLNCYKRV